MHNTNRKDNKLLDMIFQGQAQFQFLSWKNLKKRRSPGLNLCCLILAHPIMKKYQCTVKDHLLGQGQSQPHHWSQIKKKNHWELGLKSLPMMYRPFKTTSDMIPWSPREERLQPHHGLTLLHWCTCLHMGPL